MQARFSLAFIFTFALFRPQTHQLHKESPFPPFFPIYKMTGQHIRITRKEGEEMEKDYFIKKVPHERYGELYQFLEVDRETGEGAVVDPFEAGLLVGMQPQEHPLLFVKSKRGADARGFHRGQGFVVQKGSKFAASVSAKCPKKHIRRREELMLAKLLVPLHTQLLVMEDIEFDSPIAALGAAIGGWARAEHGWKEQER
ncbi:methionine sulfoxide reductase [Planococcus sp. FY231025]|uniref:methionine sulfoxide reductase n=1 Tax=Planococcus sp. FY231025 TaxID=3455699 RepID=UPI003F937853